MANTDGKAPRLIKLLLTAVLGTTAHAENSQVAIRVAGPEVVVFSHERQACEALDFPDAPARAIRLADGSVRLFAAHYKNRSLHGSSLNSVQPDCRLAYVGGESSEPGDYDDRTWIASPLTDDGRKVLALTHIEYQGHRHWGRCNFRDYVKCWMNSIGTAISEDGGSTFFRPINRNVMVATLPYRYDPSAGVTTGYINPSNIVKSGSWWYVMFWAAPFRNQKKGVCIARTNTPFEPSSWRAWDGLTFSVAFLNPYMNFIGDPTKFVCTPVAPNLLSGPIMSLGRFASANQWLAIYQDRRRDGEMAAYFATSGNLTDWQGGGEFFDLGANKTKPCSGRNYSYPALLDPNSDSRNFDTLGEESYLYVTKSHISRCRKSEDRDLIRIPIHLLRNQTSDIQPASLQVRKEGVSR